LRLFQRTLGGSLPLFRSDFLALVQLQSEPLRVAEYYGLDRNSYSWHLSGPVDIVLHLRYHRSADAAYWHRGLFVSVELRIGGVLLCPTDRWFGISQDTWQTPVAVACFSLGEKLDQRGLQTLAALAVLAYPAFGRGDTAPQPKEFAKPGAPLSTWAEVYAAEVSDHAHACLLCAFVHLLCIPRLLGRAPNYVAAVHDVVCDDCALRRFARRSLSACPATCRGSALRWAGTCRRRRWRDWWRPIWARRPWRM
jgi:hypothetical protein